MLAPLRVTVNPVTLMSILDHFSRRNQASDKRVIGTLLGVLVNNKVTEITSSYAIPHLERENEIKIGKEIHKQLRALHQKSSPNEVVVGWYSCSSTEQAGVINAKTVLIQEFYASECRDPIHLSISIDPRAVAVRAYRCIPLSLDGVEPVAAEFRPLPLSTLASEPERVGIGAMFVAGGAEPLALEASAGELVRMLDLVANYAEAVGEGKAEAKQEVGQRLGAMLAAIPSLAPGDFATWFNNSLQDMLMVVYLSNLTRAQLQVAEKLGSVT
jgi:translation initiation factor 3 subunit F